MKKLRFHIWIYLLLLLFISLSCDHVKESSSNSNIKQPSPSNLVVVSYGGGTYQQSHIDAFIMPFQKDRNLRIESVVWGAEYGRLLEMVRSGNVPWDVVEVTAAQYNRGLKDNLYEPLGIKIPSDIFQEISGTNGPQSHGVPNVYWSTVLAYKSSAYPANHPTSWADFWDIKKFPGARALYDDPRGNLEFALLADGVPKEKLYPLDVDRAFRKLEMIKKYVRLWWKDGTQPVNALLAGQINMSSAWSGRIFASDQARNQLGYTWNGAAHELDYWIIPKHSREPELAAEFILFASSPQPMAIQADATAYGPSNALAIRFITANVKPYLPTEPNNWVASFVINSDWWEQNEQQVTERWIIWKNK